MIHYLFPPPTIPAVPVVGTNALFPVHRIYCVGRNYAEHAKEMGFSGKEAPFFFLKPADAALVTSEGTVGSMHYPTLTQDLHHEVELVVAVGQGGRDIPADQALSHVFGYAVGLDMTRRDLQAEMKKQGRPWCIGKGFEHSAPIAAITPAQQAQDIEQAHIALSVNGDVRQTGAISDLIWNIAEIIEHLSRAWTLAPGDLIYTGTPAGVAAVVQGDRLDAEISGLTPLRLNIV